MQYMIETKNLTKQYGRKKAVDDVSIHIKQGEIYGLIGKNGAGKTTLMKLLLNLAAPNAGEISLFDGESRGVALRKTGSLIEEPALVKNASAFENLKRFGILVGADDSELHRLLEMVGLADTGSKKAGQFSLGMRQRLGIAIALLGKPELLILDEPINGLDPAGIKGIRDLILELNAQGVTFMISSHLLDELGKIATTYGVMRDGKMVEEISAEELMQRYRTYIRIATGNGDQAAAALRAWQPGLQLEQTGNEIRITSDNTDSADVAAVLVQNGVKLYELVNQAVSLEDFFIERMG